MSNKKIPIIIDGPNFINRIIELGINSDIIANQLSLVAFRNRINQILLLTLGYGEQSYQIEFVCSNKQFGPNTNKFTNDERELLLNRLKREQGVHINEIIIPGRKEKGVDGEIMISLERFSQSHDILIFFSYDRDFIPILKKIKNEGKKVITISLNDKFDSELMNLSYATFEFEDKYTSLFKYKYPEYKIENLTLNDCRNMYSNADDSVCNRVIAWRNGTIFISKNAEDNDLRGARFYQEIFQAFNRYVGPLAASDKKYIEREHLDIKAAWEKGVDGYIDFHPSL